MYLCQPCRFNFYTIFQKNRVYNYGIVREADVEKYVRFFWHLIKGGVFPPAAQFEAWFISAAHTEKALEVARSFR